MAVNAGRNDAIAGWSRIFTLVMPPLFTAALIATASMLYAHSSDITELSVRLETLAKENAETKSTLSDFVNNIDAARSENRKRWDEIYKEVSAAKERINGLDKGLDEVKAAVKEGARDINQRLDTLIRQQRANNE